jgi:exonuclease III
VGDSNTPLSPIGTSYIQKKINKESSELNKSIGQMDLTDLYRIFYPTATQYAFFSAVHRTFSKIDHILGHKASLNKHKKLLK